MCAFSSDTLNGVIETLGEFVVKTKYLHISAYSCDKCEGPVIAGSFGTRESEITRETDLTQVGAVCLSCGNKQTEANASNIVRQFAPIEWAFLKENLAHLSVSSQWCLPYRQEFGSTVHR
jgi:hypothetical protein